MLSLLPPPGSDGPATIDLRRGVERDNFFNLFRSSSQTGAKAAMPALEFGMGGGRMWGTGGLYYILNYATGAKLIAFFGSIQLI